MHEISRFLGRNLRNEKRMTSNSRLFTSSEQGSKSDKFLFPISDREIGGFFSFPISNPGFEWQFFSPNDFDQNLERVALTICSWIHLPTVESCSGFSQFRPRLPRFRHRREMKLGPNRCPTRRLSRCNCSTFAIRHSLASKWSGDADDGPVPNCSVPERRQIRSRKIQTHCRLNPANGPPFPNVAKFSRSMPFLKFQN